MIINTIQSENYADLGDLWVRTRVAQIQQKYVQFGRHFRVDVEALLNRAAREMREVSAVRALHGRQAWLRNSKRRAIVEAIDQCAWLEARASDEAATTARL